jgi:hypothetical protein
MRNVRQRSSTHGCAIIVRERPEDETPVMLKLVSNGALKNGRIVLAVALLESVSLLLGVEFDSPSNFWGWKILRQTGAPESIRLEQLRTG